MSWNFRVLVTETKIDGKVERWFAIHEIYYDKDNIPNASTKLSTDISGTCKKDLQWRLKEMKKCLSKPFLWGDDRFPEEYNGESSPKHVCGLQGFGIIEDTCPACDERKKKYQN